jgi:hypothetical protein
MNGYRSSFYVPVEAPELYLNGTKLSTTITNLNTAINNVSTGGVTLIGYLTTTDASNTFLKITDASSSYLKKTDASGTY